MKKQPHNAFAQAGLEYSPFPDFLNDIDLAAKEYKLYLRLLTETRRNWGKSPTLKSSTLSDVASMIVNAPDDDWRVFLWLAAETGLRSGELAGLRLSDIDLNGHTLTVNVSVYRRDEQTPKTDNAVRTLALSSQLVDLLRTHIERQQVNGGTYVLTTSNGKAWDMDAQRRYVFHPLLEKLDISGAGFHAFRHFNVALMDALRVPLRTIAERIGHAVTGSFTLDVYGGQPDFERNMEAARLLGNEIERAVESVRSKLQLICTSEAQTVAA